MGKIVFSVAHKILNRRRRPLPQEALAGALLAAADLSGLSVESFLRWRADRISSVLRDAERLLRDVLARLCALYGIPEEEGSELTLPLRRMKDAVRHYRPAWTPPAPPAGAGSADLEYFLRLLFGKPGFRPGQREALVRLLEGEDAFLVLPTGAGKSLVYQLAAMLLPGVCLVVEPTLSLIEDQIANLRAAGIERAVAVTGESLGREDLGEADFCYVAPERLQIASFRSALRELACGPGLCLAAVDEAHCVSEWGHDFRTSYLRLGRVLREHGSGGRRRLPLAAATGTASEAVFRDVRVQLGLESEGCLVAPLGPERPELAFRVLRCPSAMKARRLRELLAGLAPQGCGIVFCPHVEGPFGARTLAESLRLDPGLAARSYHGKPARGEDPERWEQAKREAASDFKEDRVPLLAATKAFGLGIDKPNIRYTVHLSLPSSIEAFYQEAGRAGRDGAPASAWIIASIDDAPRALWLLDPRTSIEEVRAEVERTPPEDADDVIRALYLHTRAFRGPDREREDIKKVLGRLGELSQGARVLSMPTQHQPLIEKALYRLCCLGVASDYTLDYRVPEFLVRLTGEPFVEEALERHLAAVYETVERERRACLGRMVEACLPGVPDSELRRRVFDYLRPGPAIRNAGREPLPPGPAGCPG